MDLSGEYRIAAPRERVWAALNDPEVLGKAIPGCEEIRKESDTAFSARVVAKIGPVKATFTGRVTLSDLDPPNGYTITGEGQGGAAGFAKGGARVTLATEGAETVLRYEAKGDIGGKLAQIGSRLVAGTARKLADDFFGAFAAQVAAGGAAPAPVEAAAPEPVSAAVAHATAHAQARPAGIGPWAWIGGVVFFVIVVLAIVAAM